MSTGDDQINLMSKDLEYVKDTVQGIDRRVLRIEEHMQKFVEDFTSHLASDRQMGQAIERISITLDKNTESLQEHMRRTEIAEINLTNITNKTDKIESDIKPLLDSKVEKEAIYKLWKKAGIVFGTLASVASVIYTIFHLFQNQ